MVMRQKYNNTLGIDWGEKYIGLAYEQGDTKIVFPIGYVMNENDVMMQIGQFLMQYHIGHIVLGWPKHEETREKIKPFLKQLEMVAGEQIEVELADEEYTSVQAGERSGNFTKNVAEDTIASMIILERWREKQG